MRKLAFCVALVITIATGGVGTSYADTALHQYFYNSTGIIHATGYLNYVPIEYPEGTFLGFRHVWEADYASSQTGLSMWAGPKTTFTDSRQYHICWDYIAPTENAATVIFDVTVGSPVTVLWSDTKVIQPVIRNYSTGDYFLQVFCKDLNLIGTFTKFQVRARPTFISPGPEDTFKLYKTTYQGTIAL